MRMTAVVLH